jgi:hypothetical protein
MDLFIAPNYCSPQDMVLEGSMMSIELHIPDCGTL